MKNQVQKLNQIHVLFMGKTFHFSDWDSAVRFLWYRSLLLTTARETLKTVDSIVDSILCEN
jgi:hypothetical protein